MQLVPDECLAAVFLRKALHHPLAVLERTLWQIGRNADVERAVTFAGHDVNAGLLHLPDLRPAGPYYSVIARSFRRSSQSEGGSDEAIHSFFAGVDGLLRCAR